MRARELVTIRFKDVEWDNCVVNILIHCGIAMRSTWFGRGRRSEGAAIVRACWDSDDDRLYPVQGCGFARGERR
ncbi:MAG: hypothetical protein WCE81_05665 [Halobacteriota archaeon]